MDIGRVSNVSGAQPISRAEAIRQGDPGSVEQQSESDRPSGPSASEGTPSGEALSVDEVRQVVDGMNVILTKSGAHLKYQLHEKLGEYYVEIVDDRTNEVIREIPPKKWLDLVAAMYEQLGWIIDHKI